MKKINKMKIRVNGKVKSIKFVDPYCDCSLSPNRLRFGPLIIIILLFIYLLYTMKKIKKIKIKANGKIKSIPDNYKMSDLINKLKLSFILDNLPFTLIFIFFIFFIVYKC